MARRRFFWEARFAAEVRHPNVASVYHLGSRGREIFYAMELVEGETLEHVIKRCGRLEAWIDQYAQDPDEGWLIWMRSQVAQADRVLLD